MRRHSCLSAQRSGLAHRKLSAQRQCKRLEQRGEARSFARPGHAYLAGLAAASAGHPRHIGMQPGLELEEVQVPPRAAQPIVDALLDRAAVWADQHRGRATHLEVDAPTHGVEINLVHLPWRDQTQRAREQPLDANAHATFDLINSIPTGAHVDKPLRALPTCPPAPTTTDHCDCWIPH